MMQHKNNRVTAILYLLISFVPIPIAVSIFLHPEVLHKTAC